MWNNEVGKIIECCGGIMRKSLLGVAFFSMILLSAPAFAAPSITGATGEINTPAADTLNDGQWSVGYYHLKDGGVGNFNLNVVSHVEVGVSGFRYDSSSSNSNSTLINAKWGVLPESAISPGIAVGMEDISNQVQRTSYAVASKSLPFGFKVNAGIGNGMYHGGFASVEETINPIGFITGSDTFPATTFIAEYDGKYMNYGARLSLISGAKLDLGWRDHQIYVGASITE